MQTIPVSDSSQTDQAVRKWPRRPVGDFVAIVGKVGSWTSGFCRNLSEGGIYFTGSSSFELGSTVELMVQGSPSEILLCKGKVVRVQPNLRDGHSGVALSFEEVKVIAVEKHYKSAEVVCQPLTRAATSGARDREFSRAS